MLPSSWQGLSPVLAEFVHTGTGRIGNGLFLLLGGLGTWAHPTVTEFARTPIRGAVGFGARQVAAQLLGWASGEPLRFSRPNFNALCGRMKL